MEGPLEGRDGRDNARVEVREGRGRDGGGEGPRVHRVVRVQDERDVHDPGRPVVRLQARDHPEVVLRCGILRVRLHDPLSTADPVEGGNDRRDFRGEPHGLPEVRLPRHVAQFRVEGSKGRHGGPQRVDGRGVLREDLQEGHDGVGDGPVRREVAAEGRELLPVREAAVPEEVRGLLERGELREVPDVVPAVQESTLDAVDHADRRLLHVDVVQALVDVRRPGPAAEGAHRSPSCARPGPESPKRCRCGERASLLEISSSSEVRRLTPGGARRHRR